MSKITSDEVGRLTVEFRIWEAIFMEVFSCIGLAAILIGIFLVWRHATLALCR